MELRKMTPKYSPFMGIEYDYSFDMIYVVPFEMIYDEFRAVVA